MNVLPADPARRTRVAWWGPLPPDPSTSAWQSALLLPELTGALEVVAGPSPRADVDVDLDVFNVHADLEDIGQLHEVLSDRGGIVVLHDWSLFDAYRRWQPARLVDEVRYNYGDLEGIDARVDAVCGPDGDRLAFPLLRRVCEAADAIVVHGRDLFREIESRFPHILVRRVPLAIPRASQMPASHPRSDGAVNVVAFGSVERLRIVVVAAATARRTGIDVRLHLDAEREGIAMLARETGIDDAHEWMTPGTSEACEGNAGPSDLVIDAEWPTCGGSRRELVEALAAGGRVAAFGPREAEPRRTWLPLDEGLAIERIASLLVDSGRPLGQVEDDIVAPPRAVVVRLQEVIREVLARKPPRRSQPPVMARAPQIGVNVIGDFEATTGLMEAGRGLLRSIVATGADVCVQPMRSGAGVSASRRIPEIARLPVGRRHDIDVLLLNVNELAHVADEQLRPPGKRRHLIGAWFWELGELPFELARQAQRVDEVWVASEFARSAFRGAVRGPVVLIPPAVEVLLPPTFDPSRYGIRDEAFVVFFNFDALSTDARKNPWGVIEAFDLAFDAGERAGSAQLVIKVHNLERVPRLRAPLTDAVERVGGMLVDAELRRSDMNGLLGRADVYVSLHRSEGFGLGMAEAMYLGKPVIATAYSGNVDFTHSETSCPVGYSIRPVAAHDHRWFPEAAALYPPGLVWADPEVNDAARWMRLLHDRPELRDSIGHKAAAWMRNTFGSADQVRRVAARLGDLAAARHLAIA